MVLQGDNPYVVEVKLCHLSLYRHDKSSLLLKSKHKVAMEDNPNKLPLVEPHPFTKRCWRREKSLPVFYEKQENAAFNSPSYGLSELTMKATSLLKCLESESPNTGINNEGVSPKKTSAHPKAEFPYSQVQPWRSHDLIPSFITRSERTKTSLHKRSGEEERQELLSSSTNDALQHRVNKMKIMGGRLHHRIQKRQLLYLNPMDGYRYQEDRPPVTSLSDPGTWKFQPDNSTRKTASSLFDSPFVETPQKFHWKLGAAKNALEIMNKCGTPTKLERNLKKELTMNLERLRRDHSLLHSYLVSPAQHFSLSDKRCTPGERLLSIAREANTSKKVKHKAEGMHSNALLIKIPGDRDVNSLVTITKCQTERSNVIEPKMKQKVTTKDNNDTEHLQINAHLDHDTTHSNEEFNSESIQLPKRDESPEISSERTQKDFVQSETNSEEAEIIPDSANSEDVAEADPLERNKETSALLSKGRSQSADLLDRKKFSDKTSDDSTSIWPEDVNRRNDMDSHNDKSVLQETETTTEYLEKIMSTPDTPTLKLQEGLTLGESHIDGDVIVVKARSDNLGITSVS
ncbi:organic cation transporter protein [Biomphalaria glabrata]|uniref:Uncharacterized protein n=1 Tax=Biomphalaria glabrata TaxID=6526 RepID=A0A2C9LAB4_BIOGL|nr:hypothetical protein BgiMline_022298 [Biomphalaria glabrata]KAI8772648.1 hypothetical protein BgiBS90_026127 [Biomphalaria glabrata]